MGYWRDRALRDQLVEEMNYNETIERLKEVYSTRQATIENIIRSMFNNGEELSYDVALERLSPKNKRTLLNLQEAYEQSVKALGWENAYTQGLRDRLIVNNLDAARTRAFIEVGRLGREQEKFLKTGIQTNYDIATVLRTKDMATDKGFVFNLKDYKDVTTVMNEKWAGGNFSSRIWKDKDKLARELETLMVSAVTRSESVDTVIRKLAERMEVSKNQAKTLIRTELAKALEDGNMETYIRTGSKYKNLVTMDERTSDICSMLDTDKEWEPEESVIGVNRPPYHPRCRTTTTPVVEDDWNADAKRLVKDADGNYIKMPINTTMEEYIEKYGNTRQKSHVLPLINAARTKGVPMDISKDSKATKQLDKAANVILAKQS